MGALGAFFLLTYAVAWTLFTAATQLPALRGFLFYLGSISPSLVAIALTARASGKPGVASLLRRLLIWEVKARWYVFAVGYMAAIKLTVALLHRVIAGTWPRFGDEAWYVILPAIFISTLLGGQAGEEVGWRGYALPRLATRFGLPAASVILGVIWGIWHLPLFFISGVDKTGQSAPLFVLQVVAMSVTLAWLYAKTRGSLLLVSLMHSAVNQSTGIVPSTVAGASSPLALSTSLTAWLTAALLWVGAAFFLVRMRGAGLDELTTPAFSDRSRRRSGALSGDGGDRDADDQRRHQLE